MCKTKFVFAVTVLHSILRYCKSSSEYFQTADLDVATAYSTVKDLSSQLQRMRNDDVCRQYYMTAQTMVSNIRTTFSDLCQIGLDDDDKPARVRKVPARLQDSVTDRFLADTPVTEFVDKLRVDFYFPILDLILANLQKRFGDRNKDVINGLISLQFDSKSMEPAAANDAVKIFAELYGLNSDDCVRQYELACNNDLLTSRIPKTLHSACTRVILAKFMFICQSC